MHWLMQYADSSRGDTGRYVVTPEDPQRPNTARTNPEGPRLQFVSKSRAIVEAQRRNGYEPIDGSEVTYARQLVDKGRR